MVPFAMSTDSDVTAAEHLAAAAKDSMKATTEFFGEPFKADNPGRIFKLVADFLRTYDKEGGSFRITSPPTLNRCG
jgi:hypothetical protein